MSVDKGLFLTMLALSLAGFWFLQNNAYVSPLAQGQKKVAVAVDHVNQVRSKSSSSLGWSSMTQGQELYNYDQVFTHDSSQVTLSFLEDSEVIVQENTLLRLLETQEGAQLDLERGFVVASLNQNSQKERMIFSLNGRVFEISTSDSADIQIISDGEQASVEVLKGQASLQQQGGKIYDIEEDSKTTLHDEQASVEVLPIKNILPKSGHKFYTKADAIVELAFEGGKQLPVQVHIAQDPFFQQTVEKIQVQKSKYRGPFSPGRYFWRVEDQEAKVLGLSSYFDVVLEVPPEWISPESLRQFINFPDNAKGQVELDLSWDHPDADQYLLEILHEGKSWKSWELSVSQKNIKFELPGKYEARVKSLGPGREQAVWSQVVEFNISRKAPSRPSLLGPADKSEVYLFQESGEVKLSWQRPVYAKNFELRVWGPEGMRTYQIEENHFKFNLVQAGLYEWEVVAKTQHAQSVPSERFSFEVIQNVLSPSFPADGATIELTKPKQMVDFDWKDVNKVDSYTFELSKSADFETLELKREVRSSRIKLSVPEVGVYYWRAKARGASGEVIYSRPYRVLLTPAPPPPKPELKDDLEIEYLESRTQAVKRSLLSFFVEIFISSAKAQTNEKELESSAKKIKLSWPAAPLDIKAYRVRISDKKGEVLFERETSLPEVVWEKPIEGELVWEMAYVDYWDRVGPYSDPQKLEIRELYSGLNELDVRQTPKRQEEKKSSKIDLLRPDHGHFLEGPGSLEFEWQFENFERSPEEVFFELCEDLSFKDLIVQRKVDPSQKKIPLHVSARAFSDEAKLIRYWRIRAVWADGSSVTSKRRRLELHAYHPVEKASPEKKRDQKSSTKGDFEVAYAASKLHFTQTLSNSHEVDIDGTSVVGINLRLNQKRWSYGFSLQSGEVFEGENFRSSALETSYKFKNRLLEKIDWQLGALLTHLSSFELIQDRPRESGLLNATLMTKFSYLSKSVLGWSWHVDLLGGQILGVRSSLKSSLGLSPYFFSLHFETLSYSEERQQNLIGLRFGRRFSWD